MDTGWTRAGRECFDYCPNTAEHPWLVFIGIVAFCALIFWIDNRRA